MKLSKISMALVALCAASSSFAITANNYLNSNETTGDTLNIRISGASAQDNGILGTALSLCTAGSVHRYSISNDFVYFCTPDIGTGAGQITVPAGKTKLAIYKYSVGGSAFGVTPLNSNNAVSGAALGANGNQLPFLDLTKITSLCTGTFATTTAAATFGTSLSTYVNVACSNSSSTLTTLATTYIGVSDMEPAFFTNQTSNVTPVASYALIFGVPVSLNIRNALQTQQGLTVGSDTEANMPTLSSAQLTSAYTQVGQTWTGIGVAAGALVTDKIFVARRVDSSGTQKTFEAVVAHTPNGEPYKSCVSGVDPFVVADSGLQNTSGGDADTLCAAALASAPTVFAGSGGGNVRTCLTNHHGANRGAIGILTTEDKAGSANWRFVKVDGFAPTQANAASGKYRFYVESALNTRSAGAFATSAALGYTAFVNRLVADFGNPTTIKLINGADQTFGAAGLMALLPTGGTPDYTGASSVMPWTKAVGGTDSDNCQAPKATF